MPGLQQLEERAQPPNSLFAPPLLFAHGLYSAIWPGLVKLCGHFRVTRPMLHLGQFPTLHPRCIPAHISTSQAQGQEQGPESLPKHHSPRPLPRALRGWREIACRLQACASLQDACELGVGLQLVLDVLQECLAHNTSLVSQSP